MLPDLKHFFRILLALFLLVSGALPAQVVLPRNPTPASTPAQELQLRAYLADRDIDEAELRARLKTRNIDIDNATPEELARLRPRIEAVIAELEAEKARVAEDVRRSASDSAEEIQDAVDDGASVEEAITEVTTEATSDDLPESVIYGHQIFRNKSLQVYRTTENATPPDSYPLKPGDEMSVNIFGASQDDFILRVDDAGFVEFPNTARVAVAGLALGDARRLLASRLKQYYTFRNGQLSIRIQAARTINVNVFGEVENNGGFAMSSLNTGFNALVAAGGPTEQGSVRNIQLIQGDVTTRLDVYEYLRNPTENTSQFLSNNARIYVPLATTIVSLEGGVTRPLNYELTDGETLADLIDFAGGLRPRAERSNVRVTRYVNGQLELINVDLDESPEFALLNEDIIEVPIVENPIENFVSVEGAVLLPGRYPFGDGVTVGELIDLGRLRPGARTDAAFLFRSNDDGTDRLIRLDLGADAGARAVELRRGDVLRVLSSGAFTDRATFTVQGAVRDTSVTLPFPNDGALTLEEAVLLAGGLRPNAALEVMLIRTSEINSETREYQRLNITTDGGRLLLPFDEVLVYERERFTDERNVAIKGAVRKAGVFTYDSTLTLQDLLYLAGGLRMDANKQRVEVFRLQFVDGAETKTLLTTIDLDNAEDFILQPYDEVVVRGTAEFELIRNVVVQGEVRYPGPYAIMEDNERLTDIIERSGGMTDEAFPAGATLFRQGRGYIVLDLDEVAINPTDPANMVVLASDTLYIPKKQDLVTIYTANTLADQFGRDSTTLDGKIQVAYRGGRSAGWYIDNYAGGFNDDTARKRWTTVEYANGQIQQTSSFLGLRSFPELRPGAAIRVSAKPPKIQRERREERFNWIGLAQVILGAATTITTFILIRGQ